MNVGALALVCGAALGLGLWLLVALVPRIGRQRLAERVAPYVADLSAEARRGLEPRAIDPAPVFGALFGPALVRLRVALTAMLGGNRLIAKRLRQAAEASSVERFRASQLVWAAVAFGAASAFAVFAPGFAGMPVALRFAVPVLAAVAAAVARDLMLQRAAKRRLARIGEELPTVLEFLTLALTAGEGMLDALRRIARSGSGELPREFAGVVAAVGAGVPLVEALSSLRDELDHPALSRALDQIIGALERGAPLAVVLRSQAADAREATKRTLIELAGRKEIAMLVPLVFLILPITVVFALFPGLLVLQAGF
ncbi:type II secretion system F family protein [Agromyces soli]